MTRSKGTLDTAVMSESLRSKTWRPLTRELLVARLQGSDQEPDLSAPTNCGGLGRRRHFSTETSNGWPSNPLPIRPAERFLGRGLGDTAEAQVFQNLACNWRCWYCYVPFNLLGGNPERGEFVTAADLVGRFLSEPDHPLILDISGGQPDLIPEWTFDTLRAVESYGECEKPFVWTDDNLSNDYLWRYLTPDEIAWMAGLPNHARVGCFKGFDESSFSFNTRAAPALFQRQFDLFTRLLEAGFDMYGYITLTTPTSENIDRGVSRLLDRLQTVAPLLPLRVVPLEITEFGPITSRLDPETRSALGNQNHAIAAWSREIAERFSDAERQTPVCEVKIND